MLDRSPRRSVSKWKPCWRGLGQLRRSAIPMSPNESRPQNPNKSLSEAVQTGATRRFRWSTIPAALSGLFGLLALVAIPIGIFQNIDVYQNPSNRMMFFAALGMPIALLVAGTLNVVGSFRWIRGRWLSALACNAAAYGTIMIPIKMFESAMDVAQSLQ